jgi:pyruvate dehydrogenase E1 component alpha subunit
VVYVLENNQYGEAMPVEEFVSAKPISKRSEAYSMYGVTVDGMDVGEVAEAAQDAFARVRGGQGPVLVECITYRYKGHYGGDPEHTYRSRQEVREWRQRDPLNKLAENLQGLGATADELAAIDKEVTVQLEADQAWALEQPFLSVDEATDHVWIPLQAS